MLSLSLLFRLNWPILTNVRYENSVISIGKVAVLPILRGFLTINRRAQKGPWYRIQFFHGHGQVSEQNHREIMAACPEEALRSGLWDARRLAGHRGSDGCW